MKTLSIWRFPTSEGAEGALPALERLQRRGLHGVDDVAVVVWRPGARRPNAYQVGPESGAAALSGAFWGLLFGLVFLLPLAGAADGGGVLARVGLTDEFLTDVRSRVTPGTSALFLLTDCGVVARLREVLAPAHPHLLSSTLDRAQLGALHRAFDADAD